MRMPLRKIFAAAQTLATVVAADGLSLSSIRTSPMSGQRMLMIMRRVVVLLEPLGEGDGSVDAASGCVEAKIIHRAFFAKAFTGWRKLDCVHDQR